MIENAEFDGDLEAFDALPEGFIDILRQNLNLHHPMVLRVFDEYRQNENIDANVAYNNIANVSDDDTDSTYVPSDNDSVGQHSADGFQLIIHDIRDLVLHEPIQLVGDQRYPGPLNEPVEDGECDCNLFNGNINQCLLHNLSLNWLGIDFQEELDAATVFFESNQAREENNLQRKRQYRDIWLHLGNSIELEHDEQTGRYARLRLPNCSYALVRMIWPSITGRYMGFRIH